MMPCSLRTAWPTHCSSFGARPHRRGSRSNAVQCADARQQPPRVIVIGAGAGGLVTAGRLARAGLDVQVLEKNAEVGGRVQSATSPDGAFRFDTGPSLLLFPDKYREAFEALGTTLEAQGVSLARVQPQAYRVWFPGGGGHLDLLNDEADMAAQLEAVEEGAADGFRRFLRMARQHLRMGVPHFIERNFEELASARGLQDLLPFLPEVNPLDLLGQHDGRLRQFFKDPRLRAMFTFQDLYVGLTPYSAPAVFGLLAGTELTDGVWYPLGGFKTVRDSLQRAAEACGVRVRTGAEVQAITTDSSGERVTGVTLAGGQHLAADLVVCNRDLPAAYQLLAAPGSDGDGSSGSSSSSSGGEGSGSAAAPPTAPSGYGRQRHEQLGRLKYSAGVVSFNWSLGKRIEGLTHHNVFLSQQWRESWALATQPSELVRNPNFYVHVPSRTDPSAAPPGCDSVMVLLPVANRQQCSSDYGDLVAEGRRRVLQTFAAAGLADVEACILHEQVIAPPEWERRYGLRHGAAFGLAHGLDQLSLFRPANKDGNVQGLYFVGASTRPGNGVPLCFISAKLTAQRVLKDLQS